MSKVSFVEQGYEQDRTNKLNPNARRCFAALTFCKAVFLAQSIKSNAVTSKNKKIKLIPDAWRCFVALTLRMAVF